MAVRFDADGEDYTRALSLGSQSALTVCCWFKISTDRNTWSSAFFIDNGQTDNWGVQTAEDGVTVGTVLDGNSTTGFAATVGTWYFICFASSGTTGTLYRRTAGDTPLSTTAITGVTATNAATLRLGESPWGAEWLNGSLAAVKVWNVQLTQAEIELEAAQYVPNRVSSLVGFYPLVKPETTDYSGNARTLSGGTGATIEDGPPVPWRGISPLVVLPPAAGGDATASPAVISTVAAVPQAAPSVSDTATPDAVSATASLPQATPAVSDTAAPAAIAAVVLLPQAAPSVGVTISPVTVTATAALPQSGGSVGAGPAVIPVMVTLPQATPQVGGNVTVAPGSITAIVSVSRADINVVAGQMQIATTVSLPLAVAAVSDVATPAAIPVTVTLPSTTRDIGAGPGAILAAVTLPSTGMSVGVGPSVISVVVTLPQATGVDEGAQVNGTSVAQVSALAAVAVVTQRDSSTPTVSDG